MAGATSLTDFKQWETQNVQQDMSPVIFVIFDDKPFGVLILCKGLLYWVKEHIRQSIRQHQKHATTQRSFFVLENV